MEILLFSLAYLCIYINKISSSPILWTHLTQQWLISGKQLWSHYGELCVGRSIVRRKLLTGNVTGNMTGNVTGIKLNGWPYAGQRLVTNISTIIYD